MLGRKTYTRDEVDHAKTTIAAQLKAYDAIIKAAPMQPANKKLDSALSAFEPLFFANLLLALDRPFVHRVRPVTGKDGNPLNEVEMLCASLMHDDGVLTKSTVIKLIPEQSVSGIGFGEPILLTRSQFEQLANAFFTALEQKFL